MMNEAYEANRVDFIKDLRRHPGLLARALRPPVNDCSYCNANGESLFLIGDAIGKGLVEMLNR